MPRPDYCPIGGEPCQSLCTEPCVTRKPLTERELLACIAKAGCLGKVKMSFESGPYDIDRPTINATRLCEAIEAAHGIGVTPNSDHMFFYADYANAMQIHALHLAAENLRLREDAERYRISRQSLAWYEVYGRKLWGEELD